MGCNCGGAKNQVATKWVYTAPNGQQTVYTSEVQARAAQIRNNGGTYTAAR